jgi:hypothetical protein
MEKVVAVEAPVRSMQTTRVVDYQWIKQQIIDQQRNSQTDEPIQQKGFGAFAII